MKASKLIILIVVAAISFLAGWAVQHVTRSEGGYAATQRSVDRSRVYAMNVVVSGVPFWIETKATWAKLGNSWPKSKMTFGGPLNTDPQRQIEEIDALIAQKVDGIVIAPADSKSLAASIDRAVEAGIPVVTYLVDSPESKRLTYIASDQEADGSRIADFVAKRLGGKGSIVISYAQAGNAEQEGRLGGFRRAIANYPSIKILQVVEDKYDETVGSESLKPILAQHGDLSAIVGLDSRAAAGAVIAIREAGIKPGQVLVTGWDYDNDLIKLIEAGWVQASVAQRSEFMTLLAFSVIRDANLVGSGDKSGHRIIPTTITIPTDLVTKENCRDFLRP
jgi:ribose transport system substrate-binding protein